ncbi:MAG TPA: MFS transporter [Mycobacteriales bacterium]|nr:MFS transporter [Mycobacteriales bacterium]
MTTECPAGRPRAAPAPLWRNRDFMLLWGSQAVSTVGVRASAMAYPLLVLAITGSPAKAGVVGFAQTLPYVLFYLPAGALVDRWDRRRVMLACDAGRAVAIGSIAVAVVLDRATLVQIALAAFTEGSFFVFFQLSESAALPRVVHRSQLSGALARNQAREYGAELAGQPLGALLFGFGHMLPFLFDALSYVVSFGCVSLVRAAFQEERQRSRASLWAEVREGLGWLFRQRFLVYLVVLIGATNVVFSALPLVMIVRARRLGASPALIGAMFVFLGVGAVLGSLVAPWVQRHLAGRTVIAGSLWSWAVGLAALPLLGDPVPLGAVVATTSVVGPAFNVLVASYRYALAPDRLQARSQSAARLVTWGTIPLGNLAGGFLLESVGPVPSFVVLAALMLAIALAATATPTIRRAPDVATLQPTP